MLVRQLLTTLGLLFISVQAISQAHFVACPTVEKIKQEQLSDWLPLYKEGEELVSNNDLSLFKQHITHFDIAKWSTSYLESAHCFYRGQDPVVDRIVLAQDAWKPLVNGYWAWSVPYLLAECHSKTSEQCQFIK